MTEDNSFSELLDEIRKAAGLEVSDARVEANKRNARRSTGPKTAAGKQRSARNALQHGVWSVQPGTIQSGLFAENATEVEALMREVLADLQPEGLAETKQAEVIAHLIRNLGRVDRFETVSLEGAGRVGPETSQMLEHDEDRKAEYSVHRALERLENTTRLRGHVGRQLTAALALYRQIQEQRAVPRNEPNEE